MIHCGMLVRRRKRQETFDRGRQAADGGSSVAVEQQLAAEAEAIRVGRQTAIATSCRPQRWELKSTIQWLASNLAPVVVVLADAAFRLLLGRVR